MVSRKTLPGSRSKWKEVERREREQEVEVEVLRTRSKRSDLRLVRPSRLPVKITKKSSNIVMQGTAGTLERRGGNEIDLMITPKSKERRGERIASQDSPNDSGYDYRISSLTSMLSSSTTRSESKQYQASLATDSGYSGGSERGISLYSSSPISAEHQTESRHRLKRQSYLAESSLEETAQFLRHAARMENEMVDERENPGKDSAGGLLNERLQLQQLKEMHLSWWETSQKKGGMFGTARTTVAGTVQTRHQSRGPRLSRPPGCTAQASHLPR